MVQRLNIQPALPQLKLFLTPYCQSPYVGSPPQAEDWSMNPPPTLQSPSHDPEY